MSLYNRHVSNLWLDVQREKAGVKDMICSGILSPGVTPMVLSWAQILVSVSSTLSGTKSLSKDILRVREGAYID